MEGKCEHKNPLHLDGTAQKDRLPFWLNPDRVEIDGKRLADYHRILQGLSELVQYYDLTNHKKGDWSDFFSDEVLKNEPPHVALFNAFVHIL